MPTKNKRTALVRRPPSVPPAVPNDGRVDVAATFTRLARDKRLDPVKLEKLVDLQIKILDREARAAFAAAFALMQSELPEVDRKGRVTIEDDAGNRVPRGRYAKFEDIQEAVKPILGQFGFSLRFRTEYPKEQPNRIRIVGILTHLAGHFEESAFEADADTSGKKSAIQARGSTNAYGRRYTTLDLLAISTRDADDDGAGATPSSKAKGQVYDASGDTRFITQPQRQRLYTIAKKAGRTDAAVKAFLKHKLGINSSKEIRRSEYDAVCVAVEASGALPGAQE